MKIDTEKYPNVASRFNVHALPTLMLFQNGKPIEIIVRTAISFVCSLSFFSFQIDIWWLCDVFLILHAVHIESKVNCVFLHTCS